MGEPALLGARNPAVRQLRRLSRRRSSRLEAGAFVVDGPVLIAEALDAGAEIVEVFLDADADAGPVALLSERLRAAGVTVHRLTPGVLAGAVDAVTPQGIAAVIRRPAAPAVLVPAAGHPGPPLVLVLAEVGDPGNAGTLLRSAEASGATALWATTGTVDLYAPKVVRAAAGSLFRVTVRDHVDPGEAVAVLRAGGVRVVGTAAQGGTPYDRVDLTGPCALVLGNEAHGLAPVWWDAVDDRVTIPMAGRAESLNVAMAGTLLCFEAARQRRCAE
jgi:TrmH family RNA methyltransferase